MKLHKKVKRSLVLALTAAGLSCAGAKPVKSGPHPDVRLSAWTAYWDAVQAAKIIRTCIAIWQGSVPLPLTRGSPVGPCPQRRPSGGEMALGALDAPCGDFHVWRSE